MPKVSSVEEYEELIRSIHEYEYEPFKEPGYKIVLVEESHFEGESIFMLPVHHAFGDGMTFVSTINAAAENGFKGAI